MQALKIGWPQPAFGQQPSKHPKEHGISVIVFLVDFLAFFAQEVMETPQVFGMGDVLQHPAETMYDGLMFSAIRAIECSSGNSLFSFGPFDVSYIRHVCFILWV